MDLVSVFENKMSLTWLLAVGITISLYLVLLAIQSVFVKKGAVHAAKTETLLDDLIIDLFRNVKKYFIFSLSLYLGLLWIKIPSRPRMIVDKAFMIVMFVQLAQTAGLIINFWIGKHLKVKSSQDLETASTIGLINFAVKAIVYSVLVLMVLNNLGVDITALVAGLGVGGVAVALALQNILADLFSSLTIVLDKPFIVGDFIVVNDYMGEVEHIGLKTTRLRSLSGEQLVFGNGDLLQSRIRNYKRMAQRRVVQSLGVTYQTTSDLLEAIPGMVRSIIEQQKDAKFDRCHFLRFQDSCLEFELVYWVQSADFNVYAEIAHAINIAIFKKFTTEKVDFAYPTQTIYMQNALSERHLS